MIEIIDIKQIKYYTVKCRGCSILVNYDMLGYYSTLRLLDEEMNLIEEIKDVFDSEQLIIELIHRRVNNHKLRMERKNKRL